MDKMKVKKLSKKEVAEVRERAKKYFKEKLEGHFKKYKSSKRKIGIEIEYFLVDKKSFLPALGLGDKIVNEINKWPVTHEMGSFQIENRTKPFIYKAGVFYELYKNISSVKEKISGLAEKNNAYIIGAGLAPRFLTQEYKEKKFMTSDDFYKFYKHRTNKKDVLYLNPVHGKKIAVWENDEGWALINSLQVHVMALNHNHLIKLFNYSQYLIPFMMAVSTNAGNVNKKKLKFEDSRLFVFSHSKSLEYSKGGNLLPKYIKSADTFLKYVLKSPIETVFYKKKLTDRDCFISLMDENYFFVNLHLDETNENEIRIEFKPLSSQPTSDENISIAMLYVLLLDYLVDKKIKLKKFSEIEPNLKEAVKKGLDAEIFNPIKPKAKNRQASEIALEIIPKIKEYAIKNKKISKKELHWLELIEKRIEKKQNPADKLNELIELFGFDEGMKKWAEYSHNDNYM